MCNILITLRHSILCAYISYTTSIYVFAINVGSKMYKKHGVHISCLICSCIDII